MDVNLTFYTSCSLSNSLLPSHRRRRLHGISVADEHLFREIPRAAAAFNCWRDLINAEAALQMKLTRRRLAVWFSCADCASDSKSLHYWGKGNGRGTTHHHNTYTLSFNVAIWWHALKSSECGGFGPCRATALRLHYLCWIIKKWQQFKEIITQNLWQKSSV